MQKTPTRLPGPHAGRRHRILAQLKNDWLLYVLLLPVLAWYLTFCYAPMGGLILAFKKYSPKLGIWGRKWVGFDNFEKMFRDKDLMTSLRNTVIFGLGGIAISMPCEIGLALKLNELRMQRAKKFVQTTVTFPHFISWVVLSGIMLILAVGQLLTNGRFDQIFNTYSSPVYSVADTMDTYIFRESFTTGGMNFGYSTAVGVVKAVFGLIMIMAANKVVTSTGEQGLL